MAKRDYSILTLKRLYGKSGNCCAHPNCHEALINEEGNLSDICHIEALNPEGPRYNTSSDITNKDRNSESNLILLCKNHHHIIDQKRADGSWYFSTEQLKAMKRNHEQRFADPRQLLFHAKRPSLLAEIVQALSKSRHEVAVKRQTISFEIESKITFNKVDRYYGVIEKFAPYSPLLDQLYDVLESAQFEDVLSSLNTLYILNKRRNESSDDTLERLHGALIERLSEGASLEYSEDLEICALIVIVDGFMRCKILDESPL